MKKVLVSPSILSSDFSSLYEDVLSVKMAGADWIHYDVMDGHFVNNISFGALIIKSIAKRVGLFCDVHLMIEEPLKYINDFIDAGASLVTVHLETIDDKKFEEFLNICHKNNVKVGLSIKPNTDVKKLDKYLKNIDVVLIMSVEPGFGGQEFLTNSLVKIEYLDKLRNKENLDFLIEVDGGINDKTAPLCREKGVDVLVSGSYIFKAKNREEAINKLKEVGE